MRLRPKDIVAIRNKLYALQLSYPKQKARYDAIRYRYFIDTEGYRRRVYDDETGKPLRPGQPCLGKRTVGIGFNMDRTEALNEWAQCFQNAVDFRAVQKGHRLLTTDQVKQLFHAAIRLREEALQKMYGAYWACLKANERLAIEDAFYNCESLVNTGTAFYQAMTRYAQKGDPHFLDAAIEQIKKYSNPQKLKGLQKRRDACALLLSAPQCAAYPKSGLC
ncbi:MAG: glycoside hydrolase family protein [Holosporaceae bacterium]